MRLIVLSFIFLNLSGCAYRMGYDYRELPRGIKSLYVPMFKNSTMEVGPEVEFTNQLIKELSRAKVAPLLGANDADGILQGRIVSVTRVQRTAETQSRETKKTTGMVNLPPGTYVATEYLLRVKVELVLRSRQTKSIVWKQWFTDETIYSAARLALVGINTASPNYTKSEEERVLKNLSGIMMQEAVDRLTENF